MLYPANSIIGVTAVVHDREYDNFSWVAIEERIREPSDLSPTNFESDNRPALRLLAYIEHCRFDLVQEIMAQTRILLRVVRGGFKHLPLGGQDKADGLH
jgi:hypothetical protein